MKKPKALDLFCCSGGATRGLQLAGFHVTGVDLVPRPNYCGDVFVQSDALEYLRLMSTRYVHLPFDLIIAGPPCQVDHALTHGTNIPNGWGHQAGVDQVIPRLRALLERDPHGPPYVIEQPVGRAPIRRDLRLCMEMFRGDRPAPWVYRHRWFEIKGFTVPEPPHPKHIGRVRGHRHGVYHPGDGYVAVYGKGGGKATVAEAQHALGIDWTDDWTELTEAIPPAFTEHIGRAFLAR